MISCCRVQSFKDALDSNAIPSPAMRCFLGEHKSTAKWATDRLCVQALANFPDGMCHSPVRGCYCAECHFIDSSGLYLATFPSCNLKRSLLITTLLQ